MIAERMVFDSLGAFLHVDFFRGLMHGNAPRRCHNCGRFFLLTGGYDTLLHQYRARRNGTYLPQGGRSSEGSGESQRLSDSDRIQRSIPG